MSTISTVTTLAVRDLTLGNELQIANHICILVATQGNGTLFNPNSFQEEDAVQLCIGLCQVQPEGVLWLPRYWNSPCQISDLALKWWPQCVFLLWPQFDMMTQLSSISAHLLVHRYGSTWLQGADVPLVPEHRSPVGRWFPVFPQWALPWREAPDTTPPGHQGPQWHPTEGGFERTPAWSSKKGGWHPHLGHP